MNQNNLNRHTNHKNPHIYKWLMLPEFLELLGRIDPNLKMFENKWPQRWTIMIHDYTARHANGKCMKNKTLDGVWKPCNCWIQVSIQIRIHEDFVPDKIIEWQQEIVKLNRNN